GQVVGLGKATNLDKIVISTNNVEGHVRAANTPEGMKDRIPPRTITSYKIDFGKSPALQRAEFAIKFLGMSDANGRTAFRYSTGQLVTGYYQAYPALTNGVATGDIIGTRQTEPGKAGNLKLGVWLKADETDDS